jgi:outer membrane biogenesis lipoprotein LolB
LTRGGDPRLTWQMIRVRSDGCACLLAAAMASGCARPIAPPPSSPPSAEAALARMHASFACANAVQGNGKLDHYGQEGRVRGELMLFAARPARLRLDIVSPFGVTVATLTSDGNTFTLADLRDKRFYVGPAAACNIARLTAVPVPGHVLVDLLRGEAPVLKHDAEQATMAWDPHGYWALTIPSTRGASEEIHLAPRPEDWSLPWDRQRMRVLDVRVEQQGYELYHARLDAHGGAPTAGPREDPDNLAPPLPPSGPVCDAEIPRKIHIEVPNPKADVRLLYENLSWNPPLPEGSFAAQAPPGMRTQSVDCE